jgi:hypothetical protein
MPSNTNQMNAAIAAESSVLPSIPREPVEQFVNGPMTGEAVNAVRMAFRKALTKPALGALSHHPGYATGAARPAATGNQRTTPTSRPCSQ